MLDLWFICRISHRTMNRQSCFEELLTEYACNVSCWSGYHYRWRGINIRRHFEFVDDFLFLICFCLVNIMFVLFMNVNSNSLLGNRDTREYSSYVIMTYDITFETVNDFEEHPNSPRARPKPLFCKAQFIHSFVSILWSQRKYKSESIESKSMLQSKIPIENFNEPKDYWDDDDETPTNTGIRWWQ